MRDDRGVRRVVLLAVTGLAVVAPRAQAAVTEMVSLGSAGQKGRGDAAALSADGRFVAFQGGDDSLVEGDTNGAVDVLVRDRLTGTTERASIGSGGAQGDDYSFDPSLSADGRFVAFYSRAATLVPGDTNGWEDVFVRDRLAGTTERVSVGGDGAEGDGFSGYPALSADGRFVAFASGATNLVAGDTNGPFRWDVFVRDRQAGTTERVSVSGAGVQADDTSLGAALSADGRFVAFTSHASNLVPGDTNGAQDVFVRDRQAGTTERVDVSGAGAQAQGGVSLSAVDMSADGRFVAFASASGDLVPGDANATSDVFVRDRATGTTERVSVGTTGPEGDGGSATFALSAGGRFVAFESAASNLVPGDTNAAADIFLRDRLSATTERVSVGSGGEQLVPGAGGGPAAWAPAVTPDGRFIAFSSSGSDLVPGDDDGSVNVFLRDRGPQAPADPLAALAATVAGLGLPHGTERSLIAKLRPRHACPGLRAFVNEVRALAGRKLTPEQAAHLLAEAAAARRTLGCPAT
jgi:Tol biopolymer transport system component